MLLIRKSKIPLISNLKKPACALKRDVLEFATLRYIETMWIMLICWLLRTTNVFGILFCLVCLWGPTLGWAPWNLNYLEFKFDHTRLSYWHKNKIGGIEIFLLLPDFANFLPCWLAQQSWASNFHQIWIPNNLGFLVSDLRRGIVPYFFVTVIVTVIMILAMFIFYFCLKHQDKHCIRHYDCDYDKK